MSNAAPASSPADRLAALRARMRDAGLDYYVVRGTDRFLNEYVPTAESTRVWVTGFTGSTGDALVAHDAAWVVVDGRYDLQARTELDGALWSVEVAGFGRPIERVLAERIVEHARGLGGRAPRVGFEPDRFDLGLHDRFREWTAPASAELVPSERSLVELARGPSAESRGAVRAVDERAVGRTVAEKVVAVADWLATEGADALLVQRLDELCYLTNLRGDELPYQATFRATALVTRRDVVVLVDPTKVSPEVRAARAGAVRFEAEAGLEASVRALGATPVVAVDPQGTTVAARRVLEAAGARVVTRPSPLTAMKARKTPAELAAMRSAFARADRVVHAAQRWLIERVVGGARVTEVDFAQQVETMFRESGAVGLSFKVISACGANAAMAHHAPSADRVIGRGEMMLLDTGAYYAEGYATDLTRTFFVGDASDAPTADMKRWFTLTLKAAIAGMTARIPRTANGAQLDGITRAPLWAAGLDYAHGTGHGVGINVHEAPPRVAPISTMAFEEGHVFSIEPGVYLAGRAGVRIENLCTVVPDATHEGFWRVEPMTFSPLDARLVDDGLLTDAEREFLRDFAARYEA